MKPEMLARFFHHTYEKFAPSFGYETRADTKAFDPTTPNGRLMCAVAKAALDGPLNIEPSMIRADVLRGRICRLVCFGVADQDLAQVLALCDSLERESLKRADAELRAALSTRYVLPSKEKQ